VQLLVNPLALELDTQISAHYLCKMLIFYEPKYSNIVKYTTICRGINGDGESKSKKSFNILLTKYTRSVLWRKAIRLPYI